MRMQFSISPLYQDVMISERLKARYMSASEFVSLSQGFKWLYRQGNGRGVTVSRDVTRICCCDCEILRIIFDKENGIRSAEITRDSWVS